MRGRGLAILLFTACGPPETVWLPRPADDDAVSVFVVHAEGQLPEVLGRLTGDAPPLRLPAPEDGRRLYVLTFTPNTIFSLSPRIDRARWAELEVHATPERCTRRPLGELEERRPLPSGITSFELDLDLRAWAPVELPPSLATQLSLDVPLDPGACGVPAPRLDFFARVEDGLTVDGSTHDVSDPEAETETFLLRTVRRLPDGSVLALSSRYLYWLRADRRLRTPEPGEVLSPDRVSGLPVGRWKFGDLERWPERSGDFVATLENASGTSPPGALIEVSTSTGGIRGARFLSALAARPPHLAIDAGGGLLAGGDGTTVVYARPPYATSELRILPENVNVRRVVATGRLDYPFALGSSAGVLVLLDPWSGESEVLAEGGLSERTEALTVDHGPPWRIDVLRFSGLLFSWVEPGPGTSHVVPMPAALSECAATGDECLPYTLPKNPDAMIRASEGALLISPEVCPRPFSWDQADDCLVAWETNPPLEIGGGFNGFDVFEVEDGHLLAAGGGGVVYEALLD